jgi:hypothetical protein
MDIAGWWLRGWVERDGLEGGAAHDFPGESGKSEKPLPMVAEGLTGKWGKVESSPCLSRRPGKSGPGMARPSNGLLPSFGLLEK